MLQICDKVICKPLHLIFSSCIDSGIIPTECKMADMISFRKREEKQNFKNCRPVSLLLIFGKIFERLIYCEIYSFYIENDLIPSNQSGFKQGESCINQLSSIAHGIHQHLDHGCKVKVWHKGLIHKLEQNAIGGPLLKI